MQHGAAGTTAATSGSPSIGGLFPSEQITTHSFASCAPLLLHGDDRQYCVAVSNRFTALLADTQEARAEDAVAERMEPWQVKLAGAAQVAKADVAATEEHELAPSPVQPHSLRPVKGLSTVSKSRHKHCARASHELDLLRRPKESVVSQSARSKSPGVSSREAVRTTPAASPVQIDKAADAKRMGDPGDGHTTSPKDGRVAEAAQQNGGATEPRRKSAYGRKALQSKKSEAEEPCHAEACNQGRAGHLPSSKTGNALADESHGDARLSHAQSNVLALLAVRLSEYNIARYLRTTGSQQLVVAAPVNSCLAECADMLEVEPGTLVHCEAVDASGWGFGAIVSPTRLAGQRGCFRCEGMRPVVVGLQRQRVGDTLESAAGTWADVERLQALHARHRMRKKALLKRMQAARETWEAKRVACSPCCA